MTWPDDPMGHAPMPEFDRSFFDERGRFLDEVHAWLQTLPVLEPAVFVPPLNDRVRAAITDSYYDARNEGRTMEDAADVAAVRVMDIVRPYVEALERHAPAEAEALQSRR